MCDSTCPHCAPVSEPKPFRELERDFLEHLQRHGVSVEDCKWCVTRDRIKGASR